MVANYFGHMRRGDSGVADLFASDARLVGLGTIVKGREAIRRFYNESIARASPLPQPCGDHLVGANRVAAEILITLADGTTMHVIDLFEIGDDGLIACLTYFVADHPPL